MVEAVKLAGHGRHPYVALVEALWEERRTGAWKLRCRWFYRLSELSPQAKKNFPYDTELKDEVCLVDVEDDVDSRDLVGKAIVICGEASNPLARPEHSYVMRCTHSPASGAFHPYVRQAPGAQLEYAQPSVQGWLVR
ncbi:unnamed protein product [Chrysoparadoxa australica]